MLFAVSSFKICKELHLNVVEILLDVLSLKSLFLQGSSHLGLVGRTCGLPELHQNAFEVGVDVTDFAENFLLSEL